MEQFKKILGVCIFLIGLLSSCKEDMEIRNQLSVSPDTNLEFNAADNSDVTLTVTTDAEKWSYTSPEWVIAKQNGKTLVVNVLDNSGEERTGTISFHAGTADEVKINVLQHKLGEEDGDGNIEDGKIAGTIKDVNGNTDINVLLEHEDEYKSTLNIRISFATPLKSDANISVFVDEPYLDEYNYAQKTSYILLPEEILKAKEWAVSISRGSSEAELSLEIDGTELDFGNINKYFLPLKVNVLSGDIVFQKSESRVNYIISKVKQREVKQMCIMEFNDANPLNVLEYKIEDGSYFFDALVLFAGNIGWDADADAVRFNARTGEPVINKNTDALINEWKTYIKPVHDAGIKVYMGILPHHTAAGITTLSYDGCKWFAEEMAQIIKDCQMDGVFLDEEYVGNDGGPMSDRWAFPKAGGDYFAYQMKKQMKKVCPWPTEVAVYLYNGLGGGWNTVTDHEDNSLQMTPVEYADIMVADYGYVATPRPTQTLKNCTGASIQLKDGTSISENKARGIKEDGYGWIMYFAFNPDPNAGDLYTEQATEAFKNAARGCYEQNLIEPTHYYKKIGDGQYDPNRYPLK